MTGFSKAGRFAAALAVASILVPAAGWAQGAPASWSTKDGRWNDWKAGSFATSEAHFAALKAAAKGGVKLTWQAKPDWSGLWTTASFGPGAVKGWGAPRYGYVDGKGVTVLPPFGPPPGPNDPVVERPVLTPFAAKKLEEELIRVSKGIEWDYLSYCLPAGFPRWLTEPFLREFIVTPNQTWMINEMQAETRRIYTDGRGHLPEDERFPVWEGDSIGFWDGDTLIVNTVSVKGGNWNRSQPEYSDKMETVELIRKNKDGRIEFRVTAYDPESLQKPWHAIFGSTLVDLKPTPNLRIDMWSCNENNNVVKTADGVTQFILPGEAGYKDPGTLNKPPPQ